MQFAQAPSDFIPELLHLIPSVETLIVVGVIVVIIVVGLVLWAYIDVEDEKWKKSDAGRKHYVELYQQGSGTGLDPISWVSGTFIRSGLFGAGYHSVTLKATVDGREQVVELRMSSSQRHKLHLYFEALRVLSKYHPDALDSASGGRDGDHTKSPANGQSHEDSQE